MKLNRVETGDVIWTAPKDLLAYDSYNQVCRRTRISTECGFRSMIWSANVPDTFLIWGEIECSVTKIEVTKLRFWYKFRIRKFERKFVCCVLSSGQFPGVCILRTDVSEHCLFHLHRRIGMSVPKRRHIKFRCGGINPEKSIQHSEHGEILKSRKVVCMCPSIRGVWRVGGKTLYFPNFSTVLDGGQGSVSCSDVTVSGCTIFFNHLPPLNFTPQPKIFTANKGSKFSSQELTVPCNWPEAYSGGGLRQSCGSVSTCLLLVRSELTL
jgi:hypothetical protein